MAQFYITRQIVQKDGSVLDEPEIVTVPDGKTLNDLGYGEAETAAAIPLPADYSSIPHKVEGGQLVPDVAEAERQALAKIDVGQERAELSTARLARIVATFSTWYEVQDFRSLSTEAVTGLTAVQRRERWPMLSALVSESGATLPQVVSAAETELRPRVRRIALFEARAVLARRAVRTATDAATKIAAADVAWEAPES